MNHTLRVSSIKCAMIEVVRSQNSLHTRNSVDQNETYTIHMRNSVGWCRTVCARSSRPTNWLPQSWIWSPLLLDSQQHASHLQSTSREHNMDYKYQILNKKILDNLVFPHPQHISPDKVSGNTVHSHNVTKNLTGHRMHEEGPQIYQIKTVRPIALRLCVTCYWPKLTIWSGKGQLRPPVTRP